MLWHSPCTAVPVHLPCSSIRFLFPSCAAHISCRGANVCEHPILVLLSILCARCPTRPYPPAPQQRSSRPHHPSPPHPAQAAVLRWVCEIVYMAGCMWLCVHSSCFCAVPLSGAVVCSGPGSWIGVHAARCLRLSCWSLSLSLPLILHVTLPCGFPRRRNACMQPVANTPQLQTLLSFSSTVAIMHPWW